MQVEELRLGNLVYNNSILKDIKKVTKIGLKIVEFEKGLYSFNDELKPIPLTEEILLKCGFVILKNGNSYIETNILSKLYIYNDGSVKWNDRYVDFKIKHLHQLQNLYFALTNRELNIEL